ncbi:RHS repeat-associated core domain-containing protein, partial [Pseudokineococcus sp. 1T1Z-3]|uniref:RHS repeat-associated core domain-containing protein n=1 Tax=Pseudokineococcus sp. 1T1Z-3 TaxID=3132745 RepID=UPI00309DF7C7
RTGAPANSRTTYTHDDGKNRLTRVDEGTSSGGTSAAWEYGYDKNSNRTRQVLTGSTSAGTASGTTTWGYNAADQLTTMNGSTSGWAYDANGNETSGGPSRSSLGVPARTNEYTAFDQTSRTITGGISTFFTYSGDRNTTRLRSSGTEFTETAPGVMGTRSTDGQTQTYTRDPDGQLISTTMADGTTHYYLTDNLGSVITLVNGTGQRTATYSYDPYGTTRTTTGPAADANPYRYTSAYRDAHSGLYKLGLRYMDPTTGRFTQTDPTRQEDNDYLYAQGDPCNRIDPTGAWSEGSLDSLRGAVRYGAGGAGAGGISGAVLGAVGGCVAGGLFTGSIGFLPGAALMGTRGAIAGSLVGGAVGLGYGAAQGSDTWL